jgi:organic hydroperoxide reductase OsmC/OhrA
MVLLGMAIRAVFSALVLGGSQGGKNRKNQAKGQAGKSPETMLFVGGIEQCFHNWLLRTLRVDTIHLYGGNIHPKSVQIPNSFIFLDFF